MRASLAALALALSMAPLPARAQAVPASTAEAGNYFLEVFINGQPTGLIAHFAIGPDGRLASPADELHQIGLKVSDPASAEPVDLATLPGVSWRLDLPGQRLMIQASDAARLRHMVSASGSDQGAAGYTRPGTGALLNYSLYAATDNLTRWTGDSFHGVAGSFEGRVFSPYGTLSQTFLSSIGAGARAFTRLQTTYTWSDQRRLLTARAGDFISGGLPWTRPLYMGGFQLQRNFGLREDLITTPTPIVDGSAAVPSTLEVYAHDARIYSSDLAAGPYELTNLPAVAGGGSARVIVRDVYGRESVSNVPFFASPHMLRKGLLDFSIDAGFARLAYGSDHDRYDPHPVASASARYGAGDFLTLSGHAEAGGGLADVGGGASWALGSSGAVSVAAAGSRTGAGTGALLYTAVELEPAPGYTLFATWQRASALYFDLAAITAPSPRGAIGAAPFDARVPRDLIQVSAGLPVRLTGGSLNLSYAELGTRTGLASRTLGASYSQSLFRRMNLSVTSYADLVHHGHAGLFAGVTIPLGRDRTLSVGAEQGDKGVAVTTAYTRTGSGEPGSLSYTLRDREGAQPLREAYAALRGSVAQVNLDLLNQQGNTRLSAQADGAIVLAGGDLFASNRIQDAFAIVRTGAPRVAVLRENRPIGQTDGRGNLLVTDLDGFTSNRIAIDPTHLPIDADVTTVERTIVPPSDSGVFVDFGVEERPAAALVSLVDNMGRSLPAGLPLLLNGRDDGVLVGYDGQAYLKGLKATNLVLVTRDDGSTCRARFAFAEVPGQQAAIAGVRCE